MTPADRTHWRYTFAGQCLAACYGIPHKTENSSEEILRNVDILLAALEKSEPKACEHVPMLSREDGLILMDTPGGISAAAKAYTIAELMATCAKCLERIE